MENLQHFWMEAKIDEDSTAYNLSLVFDIRGELDKAALFAALANLVNQHDCFRTYFIEKDHNLIQIVLNHLEIDIAQLSLEKVTKNKKQLVHEFIDSIVNYHFDLSQPPLFKFGLLKRKKDFYTLVMTFHHIIVDGLTLSKIVKLLSKYYNSLLINKPINQINLSHIIKNPISGDKADVAYWVHLLNNAPLKIPLLYKQIINDKSGQYSYFHLSQVTSKKFLKIVELEKTTVFRTIAALFAILLDYYTNQKTVIFSCPVDLREIHQKDFLGCFTNIIPLKISIESEETFASLIKKVNERRRQDKAHQKCLLTDIIHGLRQHQLINSLDVFNVCVVETDLRITAPHLHNLSVKAQRAHSNTAIYDICLEYQILNRLEMRINYKNKLFDDGFITRLIANFNLLINLFMDNPQQLLREITLVSTPEKNILLDQFNQWQPYPNPFQGMTLSQAFDIMAEKFPDKVAVKFAYESISYRELQEKSNDLAAFLQTFYQGHMENKLIGLYFDRGMAMIVAILAALKARLGYVPLDPLSPASRLQFIARDSRIKIMLTESARLTDVQNLFAENMVILDINSAAKAVDNTAPIAHPHENDMAYIIYTSGTTGEPKGAIISHRNVLELLAGAKSYFNFSEQDVWTLFHSYAFDFSVWEIWGAFLNGGCLLIVSAEAVRDPVIFSQLILDEKITILNQTPSAFLNINTRLHELHKFHTLYLRYIIFGGEVLPLPPIKNWLSQPQPQLVNMYGVTESTILSSYCPLNLDLIEKPAPGSPIGIRLPHSSFYVLNSQQRLAPMGAVGELYIGGHGVGRGYLYRKDLTNTRFIKNPFLLEADNNPLITQILYKTGDLVCYQEDGSLRYIGRNDKQIKLRGYRIEIGEIEAVINSHPLVIESVVMLYSSADLEPILVAYFVCKASPPANLREYAAQKLPAYMVPAVFMAIPAFTLNQNGKLDLNSLPVPTAESAQDINQLPTNSTESELWTLWKQILPIKPLSTDDNFFHLGGNSLLAIRMIALANERGLMFSVQTLFENPTIIGLAKKISSGQSKSPDQELEFLNLLYGHVDF